MAKQLSESNTTETKVKVYSTAAKAEDTQKEIWEFSPLYSTTFDKKNKSDKRTYFFVNGGNDEARVSDYWRFNRLHSFNFACAK